MKVSLNTVKEYIDFELPEVSELAKRINAQLGGIEQITNLHTKYKDALIVKVVSAEKHPDADRLTVTKIDDGNKRADVERDVNGFVQVVCGAPNVTEGMWAVWLPPKSIVPSSFDDAEQFTLDSRMLRGEMSHGMLAAADELAIGSDHEGIIALTESDLAERRELSAGASFAKAFDLDDTIVDIENKMFTHRPDLFGQLGVAREISAILGGLPAEGDSDTRFVNPNWYWEHPEFSSASGIDLTVQNDVPEKVARFMSVGMDNVAVGPSPFWLQCKLVAMGGKPVSNVVDITNYIMLITAQPTHAYDYDKLRGGVLGSRMAKQGEAITLLNGKTYTLSDEDIVIVDGGGPIGLAGIMGGNDSEVTADTKRVAIEVATFDMYTLRKSSMRHGLFTDALTRFNKGQSRMQNDRVLAKLIGMFGEHAGARQSTDVIDLVSEHDYLGKQLAGEIEVSIAVEFINQRLGTELDPNEIMGLLRRANFASYAADDNENLLTIGVPFWRTDIELPEDIVEEVGRLYGFDKLPRELPTRTMIAAAKNPRRQIKQKIRDSLSRAGANEVLTYSFVHENIMKRAEQDISQAFKLSNALSPDLQYYRLTVLPSLLEKVHPNIKSGYDEITLFEIGKGHNKKYHADDDEGLPGESHFVDAVYTSRQSKPGAAYYQVRRMVDQLCSDLGFAVHYKPIEDQLDFPVTAPFDLSRSALIETANGDFIGMIGELKQSVVRGFKLPEYTAAMTLDLGGLQVSYETANRSYSPLSKFPSLTQDISLKVPSAVAYNDVRTVVVGALMSENITFKLTPVAIYQPDETSDTKTITMRIIASSDSRTLVDSDVTPYLDAAAKAVKTSVDGERI